MELMDNVSYHERLCKELNDLYAKKNRDYGNSFHDTYLEEGLAMSRIRLSDKLARFKKLSHKCDYEGDVENESIRDTLIDLANYALMTVMELDLDVQKREESIESHPFIKKRFLDIDPHFPLNDLLKGCANAKEDGPFNDLLKGCLNAKEDSETTSIKI